MARNGRTQASGGWTARLGTSGLAAAIAGPLCAHSDLVQPLTGFLVMAIGLLLALVSIVTGLLALARGGGGNAARAMVPGLVVVGTVAAVLVTGGGGGDHPRINDITTDPERPPELVGAAMLPENLHRDMRYPGEEFARQQREGYPDLAPLELEMAPDDAFARVVKTAKATDGWEITREDPATRTLEGTATSWLFHFRDDFVVEVRPEGQGSMVHMRSKSRDGKGDMGVNAARIQEFLARVGG